MATNKPKSEVDEQAEAAAAAAAEQAKQQVVDENDELEVTVVDDTPEKDKGRTKLSQDKVKAATEPTDEELAELSEKSQARFKQMQHAYHDQRRAAEAAERERAAALEFAKAQYEQVQALKKQYADGEKTYVGDMQKKATEAVSSAELELKAATEAFDADKIVAAQRKLTKALMEQARFENWKPAAEPPSQAAKDVVQPRQFETASRVPEPDARAKAWLEKNQWFELDKEMTGFAYGVDARLAAQGITAATDPDKYYAEIDRRVRDVFPDRFEGEDQPQRNKREQRQDPPQTTVAPVRRSPSGKRVVTLTRSQEAMAKRLGISVADYAAELMKLEQT